MADVGEYELATVTAEERQESPRRRRWLGRLGALMGTLLVLVALNFFLPRAVPGDPIERMLEGIARNDPSRLPSEEAKAAAARYYGLDRPLPEQFGRYVSGLARGDLGTSLRFGVPVRTLIAERLPWTLLLAGTAFVVAVAVGLGTGLHSGWKRGRPVDSGLLMLFLTIQHVPVFFSGSLALFVFAVKLGWVPVAGARTAFSESSGLWSQIGDVAHHLVLPAALLGLLLAALQYRVARASMVNELGADYLLLGRAKGVSERRLQFAYAGRNALLPVVTLAALQLSFAVTGSIFIERVFAYPGLGRLTFQALESLDYPLLQGCFVVFSVVIVAMNFLVDALYARLDPRTTA